MLGCCSRGGGMRMAGCPTFNNIGCQIGTSFDCRSPGNSSELQMPRCSLTLNPPGTGLLDLQYSCIFGPSSSSVIHELKRRIGAQRVFFPCLRREYLDMYAIGRLAAEIRYQLICTLDRHAAVVSDWSRRPHGCTLCWLNGC